MIRGVFYMATAVRVINNRVYILNQLLDQEVTTNTNSY